MAGGAVVAVVLLDLFVFRTRLLTRKVFWTAYAIIVFFQLVSNAIFTGLRIVRYDPQSIIGSPTPADQGPPFLGDGRIGFAPVEDLLFGFTLVLFALILWVWWGRVGVGRIPMSGPPRRYPGRNRDAQAPVPRDAGA